MNTYTEKELIRLRNSIFTLMDGLDPYVAIKVDGEISFPEFRDILHVLEKSIDPYAKDRQKVLRRIHELVFVVPIKEIPLHINLSPVIAKWRLELNK